MKALIVLGIIALSAEATADRRVYDIKATSPGPHERSCGATRRMLRDKHILTIDDKRVYVNGFAWNLWDRLEYDDIRSTISFHESADGESQKVALVMDLYLNDRKLVGQYILYGEGCSDSVNIVGVRR